jgi:hypothetical protein
MFVYDFSSFKSMVFFYAIDIFMIESKQRNKNINLKLEIHIQTNSFKSAFYGVFWKLDYPTAYVIAWSKLNDSYFKQKYKIIELEI